LDPSRPDGTPDLGDAQGTPGPAVSVRCWGTRGSIPSPGPETVEFGGNTSCVEIQAGGTRIILDAGTGIRLLGQKLEKEAGDKLVNIFLTHFHWDHIQGLPFFPPAYDPEFNVHVFGPAGEGRGIETLLSHLMEPIHFPVTFQDLPASITFSEVEEGDWVHEGVQMRAMRMRHPSITFGYRVEALGRSVVFIPDNELEGGSYPTPGKWRRDLGDFVRGADVLFHDAMFTEEEGPPYEGWGHSTYEEAVELALRSDVKRLYFFHHSPARSDAEIRGLLDRFRGEISDRGGNLELHAAAEGTDIPI
jgi:phosphoribosyl 1,2-cyclic phosphodiesterase